MPGHSKKSKGMGGHYGTSGMGRHSKPHGMAMSNPLRLVELNPAGGALPPVPPPFVMPRGADPRNDPRYLRPRGMAFEHGSPETRVAQGALAATVGSLNPAFGVLVAADPLGWF